MLDSWCQNIRNANRTATGSDRGRTQRTIERWRKHAYALTTSARAVSTGTIVRDRNPSSRSRKHTPKEAHSTPTAGKHLRHDREEIRKTQITQLSHQHN